MSGNGRTLLEVGATLIKGAKEIKKSTSKLKESQRELDYKTVKSLLDRESAISRFGEEKGIELHNMAVKCDDELISYDLERSKIDELLNAEEINDEEAKEKNAVLDKKYDDIMKLMKSIRWKAVGSAVGDATKEFINKNEKLSNLSEKATSFIGRFKK